MRLESPTPPNPSPWPSPSQTKSLTPARTLNSIPLQSHPKLLVQPHTSIGLPHPPILGIPPSQNPPQQETVVRAGVVRGMVAIACRFAASYRACGGDE